MATVPKSLMDWYNNGKVNVSYDPNAIWGQSSDTTNSGNLVTPRTVDPEKLANAGYVYDPNLVKQYPGGGTANQPTNTGSETTTLPSTDTSSGLLSSVTMPNSAKVNAASYTPTLLGDQTNWNVTPDQTVSGQINKTIAQDSPLMQLARTQGLQQANSRGLLNSSMAVGSAQDAVYKNALPIAQADSDVYSRAAGYNADTSNTFKTQNFTAQNEASKFGAEAQNRANEFNATNEFNQYQNEFDKQQQLFQANVDASLKQIDNEANFDQQLQAVFGTLSKDFSNSILAINTDPNMDQQSKDYSIQQLYAAYKAQLSLLSAVGSVPDVSELLTFDVTAENPG